MNQDLVDEIKYMEKILTKSGFFSKEEILEILQDQFIEEDIDFSKFKITSNNYNNTNFNRLEDVFNLLASEKIIAIHNCGYDIEEGVLDAFELYNHLKNNNFNPDGFCFYSFEDIEEAIHDEKLKITFGDFENNESKALAIGKTIVKYLKNATFTITWDESINNQIEINQFKWDKSFKKDIDYEIEGAYETFTKIRC